jgi:hypothetical protein
VAPELGHHRRDGIIGRVSVVGDLFGVCHRRREKLPAGNYTQVKRFEKPLYWLAVAAATGMTAWFGSAFVIWLAHQFTIE